MKKQTRQNRSRGLFLCLLSLLMTLGGTSSAWGDNLTIANGGNTNQYVPLYGSYADTNGAVSEFIVPAASLASINGKDITKLTFYTSTPSDKVFTATFKVYLKEIEETVYDDAVAFGSTDATTVYTGTLDATGTTMVIDFSSNYKYNGGNLLVGIQVTSSGNWSSALIFSGETQSGYTGFSNKASIKRQKFIPKTTFTTQTEGPGFEVKNGSTTIESPFAYSFGLATAGTTKVFTLSNPGTAAVEGLSVSKTGSFGATLSATSIAAGGEATLTVTMPDATGSSTITLSSTTTGIDNFVINASGTVRDPNKVYENGFTALPEDWTTTGTWYYSEANGAYTTVWDLSSNARLITPKLTISEGEKFFVEAKGYSTSNTSYQHLQMQYSADGSSWTNFGSEPSLDPTNWNTFEFTGAPAGNYYIAINASQADIRMFYGGELLQEPKMVVTQPASLDFGVITAETTKTFTIANTGHATLEGISVTSSNSSIFTITGAPTSLEAGTSAEVTITMAATTTGALSSDITVSATGMTDVQFTVTGVVLPDGLMVVDFNDNALPANWTNAASYKWSFSDGKAYCTSAAELVTPKLSVEDGDMLAIAATSYDNYDNNYLEVYGSADGTSWDLIQKFISRSQIPYGSYATLVVTGIPTTTKYIKFKGYYVRVDEIAGLTYAPVLSVTTGDPAVAVTSPTAYDFGECAADAITTYHFTNAGAGDINITNVTITGDGAAAYSTSWTTSKPVPFDLDITRTYNAAKAGTAQAATVTVTTTEGDFVINVTGTDKAANAPELAVNPSVIDFGKTTADAVTTVDVTNNGTGSMSVNIFSNSGDFTVSPASLTGIGAGETKSFNVTFKHAAPYGVKNGQIVVMPTYDTSAAVNINVTGKAKDPNAWSEDFTANTAPAGWEAGDDWTIADGVAKGAYAYGSTTYLTTPTLKVNGTTDELTFDYQATTNYVSIVIQMSKDGAAFTDLHTISDLDKNDAGSYTITGLEAGNYQFRFKNDNYTLDNFEGFVLNMADHIMTITDNTIPTSGLKEGQSFVATVTVKEIRGVNEENVVATLYMGTEVIGTSEPTNIAAGESKVISMTCTPTTSGTNVEMYIEVEYTGGTLSTTPVTRNVAAITYLTLDETSSDAIVAGTYDNVTLKRQFTSGWNTVCLPFTISDVEAFFGAGAKAYNFSSYTDGNLGFTKVTTLTASYPYIVYVPTAITDDIALTNITIASGDATPFYRYQSGAYFRGTYAPVAAGEWTKNADTDIIYGVVGSTGKIQKAGSSATIKGFRAYFDLPAGAAAPSISFEDTTTGITEIHGSEFMVNDSDAVYNLNGQKVQNAHKGLYIVNGRKVVVK